MVPCAEVSEALNAEPQYLLRRSLAAPSSPLLLLGMGQMPAALATLACATVDQVGAACLCVPVSVRHGFEQGNLPECVDLRGTCKRLNSSQPHIGAI